MKSFSILKTLGALFLTVFFVLFLFLPLWTVLEQGLDWKVLCEVCRNPLYLEGIWNSFCISIVTTLLVFLFSFPLALLYDRYDFPWKNACPAMMMAPMILPPFVGALGFQQILGHYGVLNSILAVFRLGPYDFLGGDGRFWSICVMEALHLYPIVYLNLVTALANQDPQLIEAAKNMGIPARERFFRITLPLTRPGILAGGSIVLIWSFTELGTPLMFGYNTVTPVQVFNGITELGTNPAAYTLVIVMLLFSVILYLAARLLLGDTASAAGLKGNALAHTRTLPGWRKYLPTAAFSLFTFVAILPHLALILTAGSESWYRTILPLRYSLVHFQNALSDQLVAPSIVNSIRYSVLATILAVLAGGLAAWWAKRSRSFLGKVFDLTGMLPLMIPGIVLAVGFLGMYIRYPWAASIFDPINNPVLLLAAAYAIRRVPYVLRAAASGLEQTPIELENAARNTGAGPFRVFLRIVLPLIAANLLVGGLFAFSFSMLEVSDSLILAQKTEFYPITKAIYELSQYLGTGPYVAAAFGVWAMAFLASALIAASVLLGKKLGALFRL